jgi:hypothetical protein
MTGPPRPVHDLVRLLRASPDERKLIFWRNRNLNDAGREAETSCG